MPEGGDLSSLAGRLRALIQDGGPITFAEFMDAALYDPDGGFYSHLPVGERGHFVTSPHVSPVFGELVGRQIKDFWELLDRPDPFTLVEVGAGDGTLAGQILESMNGPSRTAVDYVGVERSAAARSVLEARQRTVPSLEEVEPGGVGCVFGNEVLDNVPFHRVRGTSNGVAELFVDVEEGEFVLVEGPPSSDAVERLAPTLAPGEEWVVSPEGLGLVERATRVLRRGYVWLVDYGFTTREEGGSVHAYRHQRLEEDVLSDPGSRDITSGVDFAALAGWARERGHSVWGPVTQRDVLLSLGFRGWDEGARERQHGALADRRGVDALRIYSDRNRANLLVSPTGLGAFYVICLGVATERSPRWGR